MRTLARERERAELLRRLRSVRPESARRWGRMSAPQMVCHLSDAFRMGMGRKPVSGATGLLQRTIVKSPHPIFGRMSDGDWLRWGYLHMEHHLRQFGA